VGTILVAINQKGRAVTLRFWAWGDNEDDAMQQLHFTFEVMHHCLRWISDGVKNHPPEL